MRSSRRGNYAYATARARSAASGTLFCTLLVCNVVVGSSNVKAVDFSVYGSDLLFNPIEFIENLFQENKSIVDECLLNGKEVALELNNLKDNKSEFRKSLRNVLDEYYSTPKSGKSVALMEPGDES